MVKVFYCEQRSDEWLRIKRGIPSASQFDRILSAVECKPSKSQNGYIDELIAEQVSQDYSEEPEQAYSSAAMRAGVEYEPMARSWYAFDQGVDVEEVGFVLSSCGRFGVSPDGLIGDKGILEIKRPLLKTHVKWLREGGLPNDHKVQCHAAMLASERDWCDFLSYSPSDELDNLVVRVVRDDFTQKLSEELERFLAKYRMAMEKLGLKCKRPIDDAEFVNQ